MQQLKEHKVLDNVLGKYIFALIPAHLVLVPSIFWVLFRDYRNDIDACHISSCDII